MDYFTEEDKIAISPVPFKSLLRTLAPVKYISVLTHIKKIWDLIQIQLIFTYRLLTQCCTTLIPTFLAI